VGERRKQKLSGRELTGERDMAGKQHQVGLARGTCVKVVQQLVTLGCSSALALAMGCAELDEGGESYCDLNPDLGPCATEDVIDTTNPWWCVGRTPEALPLPQQRLVGFIQPVLDWGSRQPLAGQGLTATLCQNTDSGCTMPVMLPTIGATQTIRPGMLGPMPFPPEIPAVAAGVLVPEGFDGFVKWTVPPSATGGQQFMPAAYYLGGEISGALSAGGPILMLSNASRATILRDSFPEVDPPTIDQLGTVAVGVFDCNGGRVPGARIEISFPGGQTPANLVPFQLPASRLPVAIRQGTTLTTSPSGNAGYLNVTPGTVQLTAYRPDRDSELIGSVELGSVAGQFSVAPIRPAYSSLKADLRGPDPDMAMMMNMP
jgi:hypothetical protein